MGKHGVTPAPTALKVLQGARPSRVNLAEPKPDDRVCPGPPEWLPIEAKRLWRRIAPDLHAKKVLTWWDRDSFAVLMEAYVVHRWASAAIAEHGILVGDAERVKNPALQIQRDAAATIRTYVTQFGLTPSSRQDFDLGVTDDDEARRLLS